MPLKTLKKDSADTQTLEWILQVKNYKLTLDKKRCKGCQICSLACPKEAITIQKQPKTAEGKAQKAHVDFDLEKCTFCGICDITCPYGAVKVTANGAHDLSVINRESYPQLIRDITVNSKPCPKDCQACQTSCPLELITVTKTDFSGNPVTDVNTLSPSARKRVDVNVQIQKEYCPTCKVCEANCPVSTIKVNKTFEGTISINRQKCPEGCTNCLDVCPITGALYLGNDKKVHVNQMFCTYCGACKNVCPVEEALCLTRTRIHHTPVHSGAWNKALQRLTSNLCATKELTAQADEKRREALIKRFAASSRW